MNDDIGWIMDYRWNVMDTHGQLEDTDRRIWLQDNFQKLLGDLNLKELEEVYHQVWKQTADKLLYRIADEERTRLRKEVEKLEIENNQLRRSE